MADIQSAALRLGDEKERKKKKEEQTTA